MQGDFVVIGSGIAGLYYAILASQLGKVIIITKDKVTSGATRLAQGGVAASISPSDSPRKHYEDTLIAGAGLCDTEAVNILVTEGVERIKELIEAGMEFTKTSGGELDLGMEGGHSEKRIVHSKDHTGFDIHTFLLNRALETPNIEILENNFAIDIITEHHIDKKQTPKTAYGVYVLDEKTQNISTITAKTVCVATGGAGRVYRYSTNPPVSTGDGIAMAYRAGCKIRNMEFIQFHPTALYCNKEQPFLISEALRGYGARLVLADGEAFMERYDERKDLAPRDVVARAIDTELKKTGDECVYLDVTHLDAEKTAARFPLIYETLKNEYSIDMTKQRIPVVPAAHYTCGGILTDVDARTTIKNLFAIGEAASTGVHGANRLASNSLLESLVFTYRAVEYTKRNKTHANEIPEIPPWDNTGTVHLKAKGIIKHHREELQKIMWNYIGIVRSVKRLNRALQIIDIIYEEVRDFYKQSKLSREILELRNIVLIDQIIVRSALSRQESRGLHFMVEYEETREASRKDTILSRSV